MSDPKPTRNEDDFNRGRDFMCAVDDMDYAEVGRFLASMDAEKDRAIAELRDKYTDETVRRVGEARAADDAIRALSRQTEALKACQERCAGLAGTVAELDMDLDGWRAKCAKAEAALKAMTEGRDAWKSDAENLAREVEARGLVIASSRQRAERYREVLEYMDREITVVSIARISNGGSWHKMIKAALADDKPQEPRPKTRR